MRKYFLLCLGLIFSMAFADNAKLPVNSSIPNNALIAQLYTNSPNNIVSGNPKGDITVVEIFDYNCMYCKLLAVQLNKLVEQNHNIRLVKIPLGVLDDSSLPAAEYALAANMQGKFEPFNSNLMKAKKLDEKTLNTIAKVSGLNMNKLRMQLKSPVLYDTQLNNDRVGLLTFLFSGSGNIGFPATIVASTKAPHTNQIIIGNNTDQIESAIQSLTSK